MENKKGVKKMKYLTLLLIMSLLLVNAAFGALTKSDEDYVKATYALEKLEKEMSVLVETRESEVITEQTGSQAKIQTIMDTHKTNIDAKQVEIDAKKAALDVLTTTP